LLSFGAESSVLQFVIQYIKTKVFGTIILPVVLYGCETWSLTLREESRLRVFEKRVMRGMLGSKEERDILGMEKTI
jgi:hypothetical protein